MEPELALRQQIALYLTVLPCPPLPVRVCGRYETTSHDVLAGLIVMAMQRGNAALNEQRRVRQLALTDALVDAQERGANTLDTYRQFSAEYIYSFDDPGHPTLALEFLDEVGPKAHAACCSWCAAQEIRFVSDAALRRTAKDFACLPFADLLEVARMTPVASPQKA